MYLYTYMLCVYILHVYVYLYVCVYVYIERECQNIEKLVVCNFMFIYLDIQQSYLFGQFRGVMGLGIGSICGYEVD